MVNFEPKTLSGVVSIVVTAVMSINIILIGYKIYSAANPPTTAYGTRNIQSPQRIFWILAILNTVLTIFIFIVNGLLIKGYHEKFFFEVSPQRDACLREQVSRDNFGKNRGCSCCGKGTTGGIPPNYAQWLTIDEDTGSRWHRPDAVQARPKEDETKPPCNSTVQTFSNAEEATCSSCTQPAYQVYL